ncbi:shikimate dehydrogenase [Amnimonas aquatica]|uniref:Shikimate dehydrogenase (NADP(+)) n=1 Tax=Amnimonas aquatica TaxID=2094561 RepID=A0A2P6AQS3_9GAMM|nr:shikimate dehydrogenase [Amnimonas aquatica]PQA32481.1 shikimate dehydrogenase [Amnimonas aquatica]
MTDRYAVIGHPIAHSKSPRIHAAFAAETGQDLSYEALLAPLDDFAGTWRRFVAAGGRGANVTVPFKEEAWRLCDVRSPRAEQAGAVNTLSVDADGRVRGDNTDGVGLVRDIADNAGWPLVGRRVLLLGAGGAARGVVGPLLAAGAGEVLIANRTADKAVALAALFGSAGAAPLPVSGLALAALAESAAAMPCDVIINATSASLQGERLGLADGWFHGATAVYDMMYGAETPFLAWAREAGLQQRRDGLGMLVEQAAEAFFIWRQVRPRTDAVMAALRANLPS